MEVAMSIDPAEKMIQKDQGRIEKWVLRKAFDDEENPYLPKINLYSSQHENVKTSTHSVTSIMVSEPVRLRDSLPCSSSRSVFLDQE